MIHQKSFMLILFQKLKLKFFRRFFQKLMPKTVLIKKLSLDFNINLNKNHKINYELMLNFTKSELKVVIF